MRKASPTRSIPIHNTSTLAPETSEAISPPKSRARSVRAPSRTRRDMVNYILHENLSVTLNPAYQSLEASMRNCVEGESFLITEIEEPKREIRASAVRELEKNAEKMDKFMKVYENLERLQTAKEETDAQKAVLYYTKLQEMEKNRAKIESERVKKSKQKALIDQEIRENRERLNQERAKLLTAKLKKNESPARTKRDVPELRYSSAPKQRLSHHRDSYFERVVEQHGETDDEEEIVETLITKYEKRMSKVAENFQEIRRTHHDRYQSHDSKIARVLSNYNKLQQMEEQNKSSYLTQMYDKIEQVREKRTKDYKKIFALRREQEKEREEIRTEAMKAMSATVNARNKKIMDKFREKSPTRLSVTNANAQRWSEAVEENQQKLRQSHERVKDKIMKKHLKMHYQYEYSKHAKDRLIQMKMMQHFLFREQRHQQVEQSLLNQSSSEVKPANATTLH